MRGPLLLQFIGLVFATGGTVLLALAFGATSDVHQAGGKPLGVQTARWLVPGGLAAVLIGFVLQAAGVLCEAYR